MGRAADLLPRKSAKKFDIINDMSANDNIKTHNHHIQSVKNL